MDSLSQKHCVPCEGDVEPLKGDQLGQYLNKLDTKWEVLDEKKIKSKFEFKDFNEAIKFVNKVAEIAEQEQHHPDLHIYYNKVKIVLWTHSIGGLSVNDFILAAKINKIL